MSGQFQICPDGFDMSRDVYSRALSEICLRVESCCLESFRFFASAIRGAVQFCSGNIFLDTECGQRDGMSDAD